MLGQYLIAFREAFEAVLIISIILTYLVKTGKKSLSRYVWRGVYLSLTLSIILGVLIWFIYEALPKTFQALFEALTAFIAVIVLSLMICWMAAKGKHIKGEIEQRVEAVVTRSTAFGLTSVSFIVVFRECVETVLFLTPFLLNDMMSTIIGMILGIITSIVFAYAMFAVGIKISIRKFFYFTSILLILLAGGLAGYGTHELIEYLKLSGINFGWLAENAYVLDISSDSLLHHKGLIGSIFAVMFGYTVKAEWARIIVHGIYIIIVLPLTMVIYRKQGNI